MLRPAENYFGGLFSAGVRLTVKMVPSMPPSSIECSKGARPLRSLGGIAVEASALSWCRA